MPSGTSLVSIAMKIAGFSSLFHRWSVDALRTEAVSMAMEVFY